MNTKRATKRSLLTSVMALVMCVVMLVGTTFAWFTDTASTAVNKIQAGTLKVDIVDGNNTDTSIQSTGLTFKSADGTTVGENIRWEPGCTYRTNGFKIKSTGNLALKYKIALSGVTGSAELLKAIEFSVVKAGGDGSFTAVDLDSFEGNLTASSTLSEMYYIQGHMNENAGNEYQNKTLEGIGITVVATQDTVESDSYNNQYDKDAQYPTYPAGVTTQSFPKSMEYTSGGTTKTAEAVAAYVNSDGSVQYAADVNQAIAAGASTIYLKADTDAKAALSGTNRTTDLTESLTIYANGADFQYGNISLNETAAGKAANLTLKVYDANNLYVWGYTPNDGVTQNVVLENCHNEGSSAIDSNSRMFYITGTTGTVNVTLRNCSVAKAEAPVYMKNNGRVTLENCSFSECASAVKISHEATGTCDVKITNTTFDKCGCTTEMAPNGPEHLTRDSSSIKCKTKGTMTLTLDNVAITNVVGNNSIVVDGDVKYTSTTTVNATKVTVDGKTWTYPGN